MFNSCHFEEINAQKTCTILHLEQKENRTYYHNMHIIQLVAYHQAKLKAYT